MYTMYIHVHIAQSLLCYVALYMYTCTSTNGSTSLLRPAPWCVGFAIHAECMYGICIQCMHYTYIIIYSDLLPGFLPSYAMGRIMISQYTCMCNTIILTLFPTPASIRHAHVSLCVGMQVQLSQADAQSVHRHYEELLSGVRDKASFASRQLSVAAMAADQSIRSGAALCVHILF